MTDYEDLAKRLRELGTYLTERGNADAQACFFAAAALEALQTERDQDRRDAERYQWLRARVDGWSSETDKSIVRVSQDYDYADTPEALDTQIDTAISSNSDPL